MIITLMTNEKYYTITLPEKVSGQYWLKCSDGRTGVENLVGIEGVGEQWKLKSNKKVSLFDVDDTPSKAISLSPLKVYYLLMEQTSEKACIYTEPVTTDRQTFKKYMISDDSAELTIGRSADNDVVYANKYVSSNHAKIIYKNGLFSVADSKSANGTFINGERLSSSQLQSGDMVYIMGLKIIIGHRFIAINNPDAQVEVRAKALLPFIMQGRELLDEDAGDDTFTADYFYRSPRFKRDIEMLEINVDPPPPNAIGDEIPIMLVVGPSMTMGMASLTSGIFAVNNALANGDISRAIPSIVMSASMLLGTVLWPILTKRYEKRRKRRKEAQRQKKYREYLNEVMARFNDACAAQEEILHENHVTISECLNRIQNVQRNLWERGPGQNDFLKLRVGVGNTLLSTEISYSKRKFQIEEDNLQEEMLSICESPKVLKNIPIVIDVYNNFITGIIGNGAQVKEFAKGLIFQLVSFYSYDEVKLAFLIDEKEKDCFTFVKWLPHVWSDDRKIRFIASNVKEAKEVSAYLEKEIEYRKQLNDSDLDDVLPYYVIFSMSKALSARTEMLKQVLSHKTNLCFSIISLFGELKDLPKESSTIVELGSSAGKVYDRNDITGKYTAFKPDINIGKNALDLGVKLSNVQLDTLAGSYKLPKMITFLEMFSVGKVEHLNALTRWKENDPTASLEAPIGINTLGDTFKLDLHEKFHGPHGLVAGMTGSGKSEFIISYILSMAVNYHPYEVAFILIDYKGGGMAKAFETLPHTAGIITNLDGAAVKRSLISIESELKHRQAVFAEASKKTGDSNIDIYKYQKLYREGAVSEPLQHLFIISDEFAELKTQQPDFMAQLISAARIGRSLGVHLILATQKPTGVVDDQIWSNSKFRICLKVQERSDSMDMLKRPDAAELSDTGRFYLQVGYNELFEIGQSAWAGAPYYPSEKVIVERDNSVSVIDINGGVLKQVKLNTKQSFLSNPKKQLDIITAYLCDIAKSENIKVRPLWLEPIPAMIFSDALRAKYGITEHGSYSLNPVIGEYDDPAGQRQNVLRLPLSKEGNTIVYGSPGSGKTTFLTTVIYSLMKEHTPLQVNMYILDFASETLKAFAKSPHVGDVILSYEAEKISNLFKMLQSEIVERKKLFTDFGGDYASYIATSDSKLPAIVIAINNFAAFTESYEEKDEAIAYLSREGTKYGIYFILAATGTNAVRFRMLQNFKQLFALQLNDETDYSSILGKTDGLYPSKHKGRGLVKTDAIYEFQTAHVVPDAVPFGYIRSFCEKLRSQWKGQCAKNIPLLPDHVSLEFISDYVRSKGDLTVPVGVEKNSLQVHYYNFGNAYVHMILSTNNEYVSFSEALAEMFSTLCGFDIAIYDSSSNYQEKFGSKSGYYNRVSDIEAAIKELFDIVVARNNSYKDAIQNGEQPETFTQKVIFINSLASLKNALSADSNERLTLILEKGDAKYGVTIIIAEASKNLTGYTFEKWYKHNVTQTDGIWIGGGFLDQYQMKASKNTSDMQDEMGAEFGFSLVNGKAVKIKVINSALELPFA